MCGAAVRRCGVALVGRGVALDNPAMDKIQGRGWGLVQRRLGHGVRVLAIAGCCVPAAAATQDAMGPAVVVGVQAVHAHPQEALHWQQWLQALQQAVPDQRLSLRLLPWSELETQVRQGQLHFVVSSPGHYQALETRYGAVRIASQMLPSGVPEGPVPRHAVGSAVLVHADSPWQRLMELRGQRVAAVAPEAFGGYQVAAAQWLKHGVDLAAGDVQTVFTGYPMERAVQAVLQGQTEAAIVRVCLLEQLVARGEVPAQALRVLPPMDGSAPRQAGCQASSALYPGWSLSALPQTPPGQARTLLLALLSQPPTLAGGLWTAPVDYQPVHEVLRTLQLEPFAPPPSPSLRDWLWKYRYWGLGGVALVLLGLAYLLHVEVLVKRRTAALTRSLQERDALAQQVAQARENMDHMGRLSVLGELSATLAHEISHPLASLSNYVGGLRRRQAQGQLQPQQLSTALDAMGEAVGRTMRVLDSVRALARKRVSVHSTAAVWPLVCETVELFQAMSATSAGTHRLRVRLECPDALLPAQVRMDAQQIQQVLLNLLKNAQDLHQAQGCMHLPAVVSLSPGVVPDTLVLAVCDQGAAMSSQAVERLFEPFYTTKPEGLGLGLSISRNIAELHGGHLQARAQGRQGGLCMELVLPRAPQVQPAPEHMNETAC